MDGLVHEQAGKGAHNIEDKVSKKVVVSDLLQFSVCTRSFHEIQDDFDEKYDVEDQVDFVQGIVLAMFILPIDIGVRA